MRMKLLFLLALLMVIGFSTVQAQNRINCRIVDSSGKGVANATIFCYNNDAQDKKVEQTILSDQSGFFRLNDLKFQNLRLKVRALGYKTHESDYHLSGLSGDTIRVLMQHETIALAEVEIKADKPVFELDAGKFIFNVESSVLSGAANTVDILTRTPGVNIGLNNEISLEGRQGVNIMVNGRSLNMTGEQLMSYLRSLPGNQVKRIEILFNPSARYDASGNAGILDIQLKKAPYIGVNGSGYLNYGQGIYLRTGAGVNLNYRTEKMNIYGNYDFSTTKNKYKSILNRTYEDDHLNSINYFSNSMNKSQYHYYRLGMDYEISKTDFFGILFNGFVNDGNGSGNSLNTVSTNGMTDSVILVNSNSKSLFTNFSTNVNYKKTFVSGASISADLDYSRFSDESNRMLSTLYQRLSQPSQDRNVHSRSNLPSDISMKSVKVDFTRPWTKSKITFEAGLKSTKTTTNSTLRFEDLDAGNWILNPDFFNEFKFSETVNAGYSSLKKTIKTITFQAGIRLEQTRTSANSITLNSVVERDYVNFFPSLSVSKKITNKFMASLAYSRRIGRPNFQELNPFFKYLDPYTMESGNPYLMPNFSNTYRMQLIYDNRYSLSFAYSNTDDLQAVVYERDPATNITTIITRNLNSAHNLSSSFNFSTKILKSWSMMTNLGLIYNKTLYSQTGLPDQRTSLSQLSFNGNLSNTIDLFKDIKAEIVYVYRSPGLYGGIKTFSIDYLNVGIQKPVLKGKGQIKMSLSDVFNSNLQRGSSFYNNQSVYAEQKPETRVFNLRLSYNFGSTKVKSEKSRQTGLEEDKYRVRSNN